jgi:hypothetical protein
LLADSSISGRISTDPYFANGTAVAISIARS